VVHVSGAAAGALMVEEMFLWSVLRGRLAMAEMYWGKWHPTSRHHCITTALFACTLSRTVSQSVWFKGSAQERDRLEQIAMRFECIAAEILDKCAQSSPTKALMALSVDYIQPPGFPLWLDSNGDFLTPISIAYVSKATAFVALNVFQEGLDRIWFGRLVGDLQQQQEAKQIFRGTLVRLWPMAIKWTANLICAFCPFFLCWLEIEELKTNCVHRFIHKLCAFYTAPCTKFVLSFSFYLAFVLLYTYVGYHMDRVLSPEEQVLHVWILALYVAEIRQFLYQGLRLYVSSGSNGLDILMLVAYIPAFFTRMSEIKFDDATYNRLGGWNSSTHAYEPLGNNACASYEYVGEDLKMARSLHGIAGIVFWVRIFYFLRVSSTLGPLWLVLVRVTCNDVFYFLVFLFVFLFSFGAAIVCSVRPAHKQGMPFSAYLADTLYFPYMEIYGEHFLDSIYFSSYPGGLTQPDNRVLSTLLLCVYLLFSAIVLMNLLIAREYPTAPMTPSFLLLLMNCRRLCPVTILLLQK
jgi:hypothetical protein